MNGLYVAGGALGAMLLLEKHGIDYGIGTAGAAATAAVSALRGRELAGVSWAPPANNSPVGAFVVLRDALVSKYGATVHTPNLTGDQMSEVAGAWFDAWRAGYAAAPQDFDIGGGSILQAGGVLVGGCENLPEPSELNELGNAVAAVCSAQRGTLFGTEPDPEDLASDWHAIATLASEMEAADFVWKGLHLRNSENSTTIADVYAGLTYAQLKSAEWVATKAKDLAGDAAGAAARALFLNPYVLGALAVGGFLVWRHYR